MTRCTHFKETDLLGCGSIANQRLTERYLQETCPVCTPVLCATVHDTPRPAVGYVLGFQPEPDPVCDSCMAALVAQGFECQPPLPAVQLRMEEET